MEYKDSKGKNVYIDDIVHVLDEAQDPIIGEDGNPIEYQVTHKHMDGVTCLPVKIGDPITIDAGFLVVIKSELAEFQAIASVEDIQNLLRNSVNRYEEWSKRKRPANTRKDGSGAKTKAKQILF